MAAPNPAPKVPCPDEMTQARTVFDQIGLKHWDAFWIGWCESKAKRNPTPSALPDGVVEALRKIASWKHDTLGERTGNEPKSTEDFDRGSRMAFYRCAHAAEEALSIIAQGGAVSGWQPIATAPKDGTHVLACVAGSDRSMGEAFYWEGAWRTWDGENHTRTYYEPAPTHWQPLPEPPK